MSLILLKTPSPGLPFSPFQPFVPGQDLTQATDIVTVGRVQKIADPVEVRCTLKKASYRERWKAKNTSTKPAKLHVNRQIDGFVQFGAQGLAAFPTSWIWNGEVYDLAPGQVMEMDQIVEWCGMTTHFVPGDPKLYASDGTVLNIARDLALDRLGMWGLSMFPPDVPDVPTMVFKVRAGDHPFYLEANQKVLDYFKGSGPARIFGGVNAGNTALNHYMIEVGTNVPITDPASWDTTVAWRGMYAEVDVVVS